MALVELAASRANRMTTLLKFIHLGTIAIWSGGLIVLPFLFWQRRAIEVGPELDRLHRLTRFVYVGMTSPAASSPSAAEPRSSSCRPLFWSGSP